MLLPPIPCSDLPTDLAHLHTCFVICSLINFKGATNLHCNALKLLNLNKIFKGNYLRYL
jgi:hypothetical protein